MFLSILAAIISGSGFMVYMYAVVTGEVIPNPASWSVWVILVSLNAASFWKSIKSWEATLQLFTDSTCCFAVWAIALFMGKFASLDPMEWIILVLCLLACTVWVITREAIYASLVFAGILIVSFVPTIVNIWHYRNEESLPWWLWTVAFVIMSIDVYRRTDRTKPRWWFIMAIPVVAAVLHGVTAVGATCKTC